MGEPITEAVTHTEEKLKRYVTVPHVRRRLVWMLAATFIVFVYVVHANWFIVGYPHLRRMQTWFQQWTQQRRYVRLLAKDPPIGAQLPDVRNKKDAQGRKGVSKAQIVVFGGPLSSCCTRNSTDTAQRLAIKVQQKMANKPAEVTLVLQSTETVVREYVANQRLSFAVVADEDGSLRKAYNAFWTPRVYGLTEGRLRWIQKEREINEQNVVQTFSEESSASSRSAPNNGGKGTS